MRKRTSYGSSGYAEQKRMIHDRVDVIGRYRTDLSKRENRINTCIEDLRKQASAVAGTAPGSS